METSNTSINLFEIIGRQTVDAMVMRNSLIRSEKQVEDLKKEIQDLRSQINGVDSQ